MAIIVINDVPDASVVKRVICRNCGVTLQFTPNDTTEVKQSDYTGSVDTYKIIHCVKCNHCIVVC